MKVAFLALLCLAAATASPIKPTNLDDDLQDFLKLIPVEQIEAIVLDYVANDKEVQDIIIYVQSEAFKNLVLRVEAIPEYIEFINYLEDSGIHAYDYVNQLHDLIGLPHISRASGFALRAPGGGLRAMIDDIIAILPLDELRALFDEKAQNSPDFQALIKRIQSPEFQGILETLRNDAEYQNILSELESKGIDVAKVIELLRDLFGVPSKLFSPYTLDDDLQDFLKLIPIEQIEAIVLDYVANDKEVQDILLYIQSDAFKNLVLRVEAIPEYIEFINYLEDSGIHAYDYVNQLHDIIGLPHLSRASGFALRAPGGGLRAMIDDIIAILPLDELRALFDEKAQNSPDFQALIKRIQSPEFQGILETLRNDAEYQNILSELESKGIDVAKVIELLRDLFGVPSKLFSPYTLDDDLQDFLKLIPVEQIEAIVLDYVANDKEVQDILLYIQSDAFKNLVLRVEAIPEYIEFINYLEDSGIHAYDYVNQLHDIIGLPHLSRASGFALRAPGGGLRAMIDDIIAILPLDELRALFDEKAKNSPDFQALIKRIQSPEFQGILETLRNDAEYQNILSELESKGIDVAKVIELLRDLFGVPNSLF